MAYKYLNASMPINLSPKDGYVDYFQKTLNEQFSNASDVWTIEEETPFASKQYSEVFVRIVTNVISSETGEKLGDDYKKLLFPDINHATSPGFFYFFNDNYWMVINSEITKNLAASSIVRRCNNSLRWLDGNGGYHFTPCIVDYTPKRNRDSVGNVVVEPNGILTVVTQMNPETNLIKSNQKFLFGNSNNWTAYRVLGGGVANYNNLKTLDNNSSGFITYNMLVNYINYDTDDIINGVANVNKGEYSLSLSEQSVSRNIGQKVQLYATLKYNGETINRDLDWSTDDQSTAIVDSNGLVTFVGNGFCNLICSLHDNPAIFSTATIITTSIPVNDYQIVITPNKNYVLDNTTETFDVRLYLNGIQQSNAFTFSLNPNGVPAGNYVFTVINSNSFSVKNITKYLSTNLIITATSGSYSKSIPIILSGAY